MISKILTSSAVSTRMIGWHHRKIARFLGNLNLQFALKVLRMSPKKPENGSIILNPIMAGRTVLADSAETDFAKRLKDETKKGFGFVPFVGAGLSAPSGVPLVWDLRDYLQKCIALSIGAQDGQSRPWNPRTDSWPVFGASSTKESAHWRNRIEQKTNSIDYEWERDHAVFQEALGATAEWRTALLFLSRIVLIRRGAGFHQRWGYRLDAPKHEVVDSCLRVVLKGKSPTIGHRMLASLGGVLRLDLILTTNFDDLLETAFAEARNGLTVFDVHLGDPLPATSAVSLQRALVKMHGNSYSLRADYSLDCPPELHDLNQFVDYLSSGEPLSEVTPGTQTPARVKNHLLVAGVSASELRTTSFVAHAWSKLESSFRVFWICYSDRDVENVRHFTAEFFDRNKVRLKLTDDWAGSVVIRHTNPGLLFLRVFQAFRHTLPISGVVFPSATRLSIPPMFYRESDDPELNPKLVPKLEARSVTVNLLKRLKGILSLDTVRRPRIVVVTSPRDVHGVTTLCAEVFEVLETEAICVWIDMNDVSTTGDLFEQMIDAMHYRMGSESWLPVFIADDPSSKAEELKRLAASSSRKWVFFINAREVPGSNQLQSDELMGAGPNGWLDREKPSSEEDGIYQPEPGTMNEFLQFLTQVCPSDTAGVNLTVVLMLRGLPLESPNNPLGDAPICSRLVKNILEPDEVFRLLTSSATDEMPSITTNCTNWYSSESDLVLRELKKRFLHRLVSMQRTRFLATIWDHAVIEANSDEKVQELHFDLREEWLKKLESFGLVRRKLGGFIWLHAIARNELRKKLDVDLLSIADIHWELAVSYSRILAVSNSPLSLFEAIYHALRAAEASWMSTIEHHVKASQRIAWATSVFKHHTFLIQTIGYSRGSCRRLEYIRDSLCSLTCFKEVKSDSKLVDELHRELHKLRLVCTEMMRAIAREVGEAQKGYLRHKQSRNLMVYQEPKGRVNGNSHASASIGEFARVCANTNEEELKIEWLRWWRWCGMLAISARSYSSGLKALYKGIAYLEASDNCKEDFYLVNRSVSLSDIERCLNQFTFDSISPSHTVCGHVLSKNATVRLRIEALRVFEQFLNTTLHIQSLKRRMTTSHDIDEWDKFKKCATKIMKVAETIGTQPLDATAVSSLWLCKCRILLHIGQIAAFECRFADSMRFFTEADTTLNMFDARRYGTDRAIVELYRVDARLREASNCKIENDAGNSVPFGQFVRETADAITTHSGDLDFLLDQLKTFRLSRSSLPTGEDIFRPINALVRDSIRFLDRAEQIFVRRRRNSFWTAWYFERRLLAIAMSVWGSINDKGKPVPFLGVETAMEGSATLADQLVDQAVRLVRHDVYRLATIVEDYSLCLLGLQCRLQLDPSIERLSFRQKDMRSRLGAAIDILNDAFRLRQDVKNDNELLDGDVSKYIAETIKKCKTRLDASKAIVL